MEDRVAVEILDPEELDWVQVRAYIAPDLAQLAWTARADGALVRCREIKSADDLIRIIFAYACGGASLSDIGAWATEQGLGSLSCPAISFRMRSARRWLGRLLADYVDRRRVELPRMAVHVRLIDATTANRSNCRGVEWRVHLSLDLASMCIDEVEVTDAHGGETLCRHATEPGDIIVADAGYAHRKGLGSALGHGAHVIVRTNWQNLPLLEPGGKKLDIPSWLAQLGSEPAAERSALVQTPQGVYPVRLIAGRLPTAATDRARKLAIEKAHKNKHKIDPRTLNAAGFLILVTSLPADLWTTDHILQLFRARWQIEMHIKRMKGILDLDRIRAQREDVVQTCVLAKLLLALIVEDIIKRASNCRNEWLHGSGHVPSLWALTQRCWRALRNAIRGTLAQLPRQLALPSLERYLFPPPRKRVNRLAVAHELVNHQPVNTIQLPLPCPVPTLS